MSDHPPGRITRVLRMNEVVGLLGGGGIALLAFGLAAAGGERLHVGPTASLAIVFAGVVGILLALYVRLAGTPAGPRAEL